MKVAVWIFKDFLIKRKYGLGDNFIDKHLVTGYASKESYDKVISLGVAAFLNKSSSMKEITNQVEGLIK
ncbi:hypothetical protein [Desulfobacula phenolica]|uniref:hypothetical protein n=1 Tax=Desulfobacula phenolica TaxID=90732 RepID=UPI000B840681|nr:hypothetical protein [Desulfobacula phenolica]